MDAYKSQPPKLLTLVLLCGLSVVSLNMFLPSLPHIADEFGVDYGLVNLSIAGYAAMTALLQLIAGPLSDRYGRRPIMLAAIILFLCASLGCLLAQDVWVFLTFRMMQAAIISCYTISLAIVRDSYPTDKAASLIGYMAMAWAVAPMIGPIFGGALDDLFGWRANFWAFIVMGLALIFFCWFDLPETNLTPSQTFKAQFLAYPALVKSGHFWGYALCMAFSTGAFYVFLGGAPLIASQVFDIAPTELGFYMASTTAGFAFGSFLSGRFGDQYALTTTMLAGRIIACLGLSVGLIAWVSGFQSLTLYFAACICVGIGNGLSMPGASAGAMSVNKELAGSAAGLSGALTVAGGALMSAIGGAIFTSNNVAYMLLAMMLLSSALSMLATFYVMWADKRIEECG